MITEIAFTDEAVERAVGTDVELGRVALSGDDILLTIGIDVLSVRTNIGLPFIIGTLIDYVLRKTNVRAA